MGAGFAGILGKRRTRALAAATAAGGAVLALAATSLAGPEEPPSGLPKILVAMTGPSGPLEPGEIATFTAVVTNQGDGPTELPEDELLELSPFGPAADQRVANPFESFATTQGSCERRDEGQIAGDYPTLSCVLGQIAPGASIEVTASLAVNEPMILEALVRGGDDSAKVTTLVDAPFEVSGSKSIKVKTPKGCVSDDFKLNVKVSPKGQDQPLRLLRILLDGPVRPDGKLTRDTENFRSDGYPFFNGDPVKFNGSKLKPGFYLIRLEATFGLEKEKTRVVFVRC